MVLMESQEIVLEEREGEGMGAVLNSLEASHVLWILAGIDIEVNAL